MRLQLLGLRRFCTALKDKFLLGFTCRICTTKHTKLISKTSYYKGVVIARCDGCSNLHLIADNLGWFRDQKTNIQDLMREKGETVLEIKPDDVK